jgi:hypothetical protein
MWWRARQAGKRQGLRHRLCVLELVLNDHSHDEPPLEQRIAVVEGQSVEEAENSFANVAYIAARGFGCENRQPAAFSPCVCGGVVEVVGLREHRCPTGSSQQPELLEVTDMREVPAKGRLKRRPLARQLRVGQRFQQSFRPRPRMLESKREFRR